LRRLCPFEKRREASLCDRGDGAHRGGCHAW